MAAPAVRGGAAARWVFLPAALVLLAVYGASPATRQACAAEDQKIWQTLTEEDRRNRTPPAVPDRRGSSAAPVFRDSILVSVSIGFVVAVFAGMVVAVLSSRRRPPPAPIPGQANESEAGDDLETLWQAHLTWKKRKRGPKV